MKDKTYFLFSGLIFLVVGILHAVRVILNWTLTINGESVGVVVSLVAAVITLFLAYNGLRMSR